jgi:ribosomal-protein-alanine N-acetyltransferase
VIRRAEAPDFDAIERIQAASPQAAQGDWRGYPALVFVEDNAVRAFLTWLDLPQGEVEILNIAVDPLYRRRGMARSLVLELIGTRKGPVYLELRESNAAACKLYQMLGFLCVGRRPEYYREPAEAAVVMKRPS